MLGLQERGSAQHIRGQPELRAVHILFNPIPRTDPFREGGVLTSPPTLDWFQLLFLIAAAADAYMFWEYFKRPKVSLKEHSLAAADTIITSDKASSKISSLLPASMKHPLAGTEAKATAIEGVEYL